MSTTTRNPAAGTRMDTGEELRAQREARGPVRACASHHSQGGSCTKSLVLSAE